MKPKIALHIPVYGREEITPFIQEELRVFLHKSPYDIDVWVTHSREYDAKAWEFDADWLVYADNFPLGAKFNHAIPEMLKEDYLYIMQMGQDDVIYPEYWNYAAKKVQELSPMFGPIKLRVMEWESKMTVDCTFHTVFGAGRMIRMDLIRETWEKTGRIWDRDRQSGLDMNSEMNVIMACGLMKKGVTRARLMGEIEPLVMDVKTSDNINAFHTLLKFADATVSQS